MKNIRGILIVLCLILALQPVCGVHAAEAAVSCRTLDATATLGGSDKILDTTKAAIVYERGSGTMIYGYNMDQRIYPSSMVKLMTALVALENGNLDDIVTVSKAALDSVAIGSVSAGLVRWEEISLRDLMYCMMVASANDAAAVIALHVGGSLDMFILMMNEMAEKLGCSDTNFSNVHGLHDDNTYTTARDICKILDYALENPEFKQMFETKSYQVAATNKSDARDIITTNYMMSKDYTKKYFDDRVVGGKTGSTDKAGRCLAITADVNGMDVIAIVMGAEPVYNEDGVSVSRFGSFEEMSELLDFVEGGFEFGQLFYDGQVIDRFQVSGGDSDVAVGPMDDVMCVIPKAFALEDMSWKIVEDRNALVAPIAKGQTVAQLQVWYKDICIGSTDLIAMNKVTVYEPFKGPQSNSAQEQEDRHGAIIATILGVIVGIVVLFCVGLVAVRMIQVALVKARIRRRRNMRRKRNAELE